MLNIGNDPASWEKYQCVGPSTGSENGEAVLNFIDKSAYKSVRTYTIDFWFKKENNYNDGQRLLEVSDSFKTITIIIYNGALSINLTDNSDGNMDELAYFSYEPTTNEPFDFRNEWLHFAFAFSDDAHTMILHLNGKQLFASAEVYELVLEEMHLYSHTKENPIYFALIRISKSIKFPEETFDLDLVSQPYTNYVNISSVARDIENPNIEFIRKKRFFNGEVNENTVIFQSFKINEENQASGPLKNIFNVIPAGNTRIYSDKTLSDNYLWTNVTGSIGPLSKAIPGLLKYKHNSDTSTNISKLNIYDWTIDFWFKRDQNKDEITSLLAVDNNAIFTEIFTKNDKILIKSYDKDLSPEYRKNTYYSIEIDGGKIKTIKFNEENNNLDNTVILGKEIPNSSNILQFYNKNNVWNHLALTYEEDEKTLQLFMNGTLVFSLEEYLDYVLRHITLNTNMVSINETFFTNFRLNADIKFRNNFNIENLKKCPYEVYASCVPIYRITLQEVENTLEELLDTGPKEIPSTYQAGGGYLPTTTQDLNDRDNTLFTTDGKGYCVPNTGTSNEVMVTKEQTEISANSDIFMVTYYPYANKHYFVLNDDGTTNTYQIVDLPFSKSVPELLWNAVTARPGIISSYTITSVDIQKFSDKINLPITDIDWNKYYAVGPTALNSVNDSVITLHSTTIPDNVWTCEFWFKRNNIDLTKSMDLFEVIGHDKSKAIKIAITETELQFYVNDANNVYFNEATRGNLNFKDKWTYFTITYYNPTSTTTVYINGNPIYTSTTVSNLLPYTVNIYLQNHLYNNTLITALKLNSGLKYANPFDLLPVSVPQQVYVNVVDIPRQIEVYSPPPYEDPNQKLWVFNGLVNHFTPFYFPIQGSNKEYDKEAPIDYNTGIHKYDDPYLIEGTKSKNYNMLMKNDSAWSGFNPIGPSSDKENGNIHITNTSGHKAALGKYTVEFWMYRGPKKSS